MINPERGYEPKARIACHVSYTLSPPHTGQPDVFPRLAKWNKNSWTAKKRTPHWRPRFHLKNSEFLHSDKIKYDLNYKNLAETLLHNLHVSFQEASLNLQKSSQQQANYYNLRRSEDEFTIGQQPISDLTPLATSDLRRLV
ncbi:hypothetical protein B566_EDAN009121 [Ephemera danica]|nr:hypothetical protein B566_EDAN009121 [Ephemera danica]